MSEQEIVTPDGVRRPTSWEWDAEMITGMAARTLLWGLTPCPLDGRENQLHDWMRFEVSYNDKGDIHGLTTIACDLMPKHEDEPKSAFEMSIHRIPALDFDLRSSVNFRPGMVLISIRDERTSEDVFSCLFELNDAPGQHFHVGNAIDATHGDEGVWDHERIMTAAGRNPSFPHEQCRICGQEFQHHERLVLRVARGDEHDPAKIRCALVIACGPEADIPESSRTIARLEAQGIGRVPGLNRR
ncbi:hypothetical protein [Streptomyces regalis]|uniref:Uncharacterized protein n=1 Tax=Streptomyces regalis TaxID=68262 RepID=A0A117ML01_9ACTN|nr:hypothetical protein [Streptomyces regalis]KUL23184.1 hypothetical protein ADL12_39585 [Streptomyces regalis]